MAETSGSEGSISVKLKKTTELFRISRDKMYRLKNKELLKSGTSTAPL